MPTSVYVVFPTRKPANRLPAKSCLMCGTHAPRDTKSRCAYCHKPYTLAALVSLIGAQRVNELVKRS